MDADFCYLMEVIKVFEAFSSNSEKILAAIQKLVARDFVAQLFTKLFTKFIRPRLHRASPEV